MRAESVARLEPLRNLGPASRSGDQTLPDRIAAGREHDRYRRGCGLGRQHRTGVTDNYGRRQADQFSHQSRQSIILALRPAKFDRALDVAGILQPLAERGDEFRRISR
jgi:hypothetical protein